MTCCQNSLPTMGNTSQKLHCWSSGLDLQALAAVKGFSPTIVIDYIALGRGLVNLVCFMSF